MESGIKRNLEFGKSAPRAYVSDARDLGVYKLAYNVSLRIHEATLAFPKIEQCGGIADQLRRGTKSICANLSEGFSKQGQSAQEFKRFLSIAIGSCGEVMVWLDYCYDLKYIPQPLKVEWQCAYSSVTRMLHSLRNRTHVKK